MQSRNPLGKDTINNIAFGAPTPGQSLTAQPKNAPYEKPPQFTKVEDVMNFLMKQLTEPFYLKTLLSMMEAKMPVEAIARTILFGGFSTGKWTVDVAILLYKPLMLTLISFAHRAGLKDTPVLMPQGIDKQKGKSLQQFMLQNAAMDNSKNPNKSNQAQSDTKTLPGFNNPSTGFMQRGNV